MFNNKNKFEQARIVIRIAKRRPVNKDVECNFVTTYSRCK
jgi:hypothetical protein